MSSDFESAAFYPLLIFGVDDCAFEWSENARRVVLPLNYFERPVVRWDATFGRCQSAFGNKAEIVLPLIRLNTGFGPCASSNLSCEFSIKGILGPNWIQVPIVERNLAQ